jgi:hypothetical protein
MLIFVFPPTSFVLLVLNWCVKKKPWFSLKYIYFSNYSYGQYKKIREEIDKYEGGLDAFSRGYEKLGFTRRYLCYICFGQSIPSYPNLTFSVS